MSLQSIKTLETEKGECVVKRQVAERERGDEGEKEGGRGEIEGRCNPFFNPEMAEVETTCLQSEGYTVK